MALKSGLFCGWLANGCVAGLRFFDDCGVADGRRSDAHRRSGTTSKELGILGSELAARGGVIVLCGYGMRRYVVIPSR